MKRLSSVLISILLIAAMLTGLGAAAFADDTGSALGEPIYTGDDDAFFDVLTSADRITVYKSGLEYLADWDGTILSDGYDAIFDYYGWLEIDDGDMCGVMDRDGNVIVPAEYGYIDIEGNFAGLSTLEDADEDDYDVTVIGGSDLAYKKYLTTQIVDLRTGEVKAELSREEYSYMLLQNGILVICDSSYDSRYFDDDFNELTYNEFSDLAEETNGYSVSYNYKTERYGINGIGDSTLKIDAEYDEFFSDYDNGGYLSDGFFCARREGTLYFLDENGEVVSQFEIDPEQMVSFYGECAIGWDDEYNDRYVYNADGSYYEVDEMYVSCYAYTCGDSVFLRAYTEDYDRCCLLDTYGNVVAEGDSIDVTDGGYVIVDDYETDMYSVYFTGEYVPAEADAIVGTVTGGEYVNDAFGVGVVLDDSWYIANDEDMAQLNDMLTDACTDEELAETISDSGSATVFYAMRNDSSATLNLVVQNVSVVYGMMLDEDDVIDMSIEEMPDMLAAYGMSASSLEKGTVTFAGTEHSAILLTMESNGTTIYEMQVCCKSGGYIGIFTAASASGYEDCEAILGQFTSVG